MKPPIFVYEPTDLDIFESLADAELKIEPIDVRDNAFVYYDADGQVLTASIVTDDHGFERTSIHETSAKVFEPQTLRSIILAFLIASGESTFEVENWSLEELVAYSLKFRTR